MERRSHLQCGCRYSRHMIAYTSIGDGGLTHRPGEIEPEDVEMEMPVDGVV